MPAAHLERNETQAIYAAVKSELRQASRTVNARIRDQRGALASDTRQMSWIDWLQHKPAMDATMPSKRCAQLVDVACPTPLHAQDPDGPGHKAGTVIQRIGEHEIRESPLRLHAAMSGIQHVFGLSTQTPEYQREAVERLHLPFPLLSDER